MVTRAILIACFALICAANIAQCGRLNSKLTKPEYPSVSYRAATKGGLELYQDLGKCHEIMGAELVDEIHSFQDVANQIIAAATTGDFKGRTYDDLAKFVDRFGQRVSGSQSLEDSIDYIMEKMKRDGYSEVWGEEAIIPHWVRGEEVAEMITPRKKNLDILGLGSSVGTPPEGITADVIVVRNFDELTANADKAKGKIVVFNQPWLGTYGQSVVYRAEGANAASRVGAVAALVRSIADFSLDTPHTGGMDYAPDVTHIPVACITIEDAELLDRLYNSNPSYNISIHLKMLDYNLPLTTSRNAIGQLTGDTKPEEIIILSGHIDSWDVGQGALDDGGGCFISTEAIALIKYLGLTPKRSLQAIMWTAEEAGLWGAQDYVRHNKDNLHNIIAAFESDSGTFTPKGLDFAGFSDKAACIINEILNLTTSINATTFTRYNSSVSTDITYLFDEGVPVLALNNADENYFWYHHTEADSMNLLNTTDLDKGTALWAVAAYVLAELSIPLPRVVDPPVQLHSH